MKNFLKKYFGIFVIFIVDILFAFLIIMCEEETRKNFFDSPGITFVSHVLFMIIMSLMVYGFCTVFGNLFDFIEKKLRSDENKYRDYLINKLNVKDSTTQDVESLVNALKKSQEDIDDSEKRHNEETQKTFIGYFYDKSKESKDIIALMLKNNDELTEYFQISKSQSRWSFWLSTLACISGIIILGITVYSVIILKQTDIAVVGVISGAIVELIAGTIFWLHNKSALQLNHYYDALHENEKVLLAINLTNTLTPEERESMCKEIIRTQIYKQKIDN